MDLFISYRYVVMKNIEFEPVKHSHHAIQLQYSINENTVTICKDHKHIGAINIIDSDKEHTAIQNRDTINILISPETLEGRAIRKFIDYSSCYTIDRVKPCVERIYNEIYNSDFSNSDVIPLVKELVFHLVGGDIKDLQIIDERIIQTLATMGQEEIEDLNLKELSSNIFLSESRFQHLFKDNTGISLSKYLLWFKTIKAVKRVFLGDNLTQAALNSGFSDSAHFTRTFKKIVGLTPKVISRYVQF